MMPRSMKEIRVLNRTRSVTPVRLTYNLPSFAPKAVTANAQQGLIRVQWAPVVNVQGYDIAVMNSPNLDRPDVNIQRVMGYKNREFVYQTGNKDVKRYFAVRSFTGDSFSPWSKIVNATSLVFGAVESPPTTAPTAAPPRSNELPPTGAYIGPIKVQQ